MQVSQQQKKWHGLVTTEEQNRRCCPDCGNNSFTMMTVDSSVHSAWRIHGYGLVLISIFEFTLFHRDISFDSSADTHKVNMHRRRVPTEVGFPDDARPRPRDGTPRHAGPVDTPRTGTLRNSHPDRKSQKPNPASDWRINIQPGWPPPKRRSRRRRAGLSTGPRDVVACVPRAPHLRDGPVANETPHDTILDRDGRFEMQMQRLGGVCPSPGVTVRPILTQHSAKGHLDV